jgi:hypothetical protein
MTSNGGIGAQDDSVEMFGLSHFLQAVKGHYYNGLKLTPRQHGSSDSDRGSLDWSYRQMPIPS